MINMYEPVAVFEHNNTKYCIVIVNGFIKFFKYIDNKLSEALSSEDIKLLLCVHKALVVDRENAVLVKREIINNKEFEIWYDLNSTLHFWYEIIDGELCDVDDEYNIMLNYKYNHMSNYAVKGDVFDQEAYERAQEALRIAKAQIEAAERLREDTLSKLPRGFDPSVKVFDWQEYENEQAEKERIKKEREKKKEKAKNNKIRRNIRVGTAVICASVMGALSFIRYSDTEFAKGLRKAIAQSNSSNELQEDTQLEELIEKIKKQPYDYNEIQKVINKNKNLATEEKDLLSSLKFYIDENQDYIDIELLKERLSTLKFVYKAEAPDTTTKGEYCISDNTIYLYNGAKLSDIDIRIVMHEIMHLLQCTHSNRFTMELSNEVATRELLRQMIERGMIEDISIFKDENGNITEYGLGYDPCIPIQYALYELIPMETRKLYQFIGDEKILIEALKKVDQRNVESASNSSQENLDTARAISLLDAIDELYVLNENGRRVIKYSEEKFNKIYEIMDSYYCKKHNIPMRESISADISNIDVHNIGKIPIKEEKLTALYYTFAALAGDENDGAAAKYIQENFGKIIHVIPKTYFSYDHKYAQVTIETPDVQVFDIDKETQKVYQYKLSWVKEMIEKMKSSSSYEPDYTNFYYFERPTEPTEPTKPTEPEETNKQEEATQPVTTTIVENNKEEVKTTTVTKAEEKVDEGNINTSTATEPKTETTTTKTTTTQTTTQVQFVTIPSGDTLQPIKPQDSKEDSDPIDPSLGNDIEKSREDTYVKPKEQEEIDR